MLRSSSEEERFLYGPEDAVDEEVGPGGSGAVNRDNEDKHDEDNDDVGDQNDEDNDDEDKVVVGNKDDTGISGDAGAPAGNDESGSIVNSSTGISGSNVRTDRRQRKYVDPMGGYCYQCRSGHTRVKRLLGGDFGYESSNDEAELDLTDFVEDLFPEVYETVFDNYTNRWRSLEQKESFRRGKKLRKSRRK